MNFRNSYFMSFLTGLLLISASAFYWKYASSASPSCQTWPQWKAYAQRFIQADGRVVEYSQKNRTTSEGQAYGLLFALVANDHARFEQLLTWTQSNLAGNDLTARLPAWLWGQAKDSSWGVLDDNAASDADLWMAYALLEAGRLWKEARYTALGQVMLQHIKQHEVAKLSGLGAMLVPGPKGFVDAEDNWRLNISYLPVQVLRGLAGHDPRGPWDELAENVVNLIEQSARHGFVPDWSGYDLGKGVTVDSKTGALGSYDAIRVYLWAGMLHQQEPLAPRIFKAIEGMKRHLRTQTLPPKQVDLSTGQVSGSGPIGFSAALLPYLARQSAHDSLKQQQQRVAAQTKQHLVGNPPLYYDQNLALFGLGWLDKRFAFNISGQLKVNWESKKCSTIN